MNFDIRIFSAENLLKGAPILDQIEQIKTTMTYKTDEGNISYEDYFRGLTGQIGKVKSFSLNPTVPPGTEYAYLLSVTNELQDTLDSIETLSVKAVFFQSKLKTVRQVIDNAGSTFCAWYQIALGSSLRENDIKIPVSSIKSLADSEFSRLMDSKDMDIDAMIQSVDIQISMLKNHKSLAQDKYKMAKDQVNASISNISPNTEFGNEHLRLPKYSTLEEKYGSHFKQVATKPPIEEDDDEIVIYNKKTKTTEDPEEENLISDSVIESAALAQFDSADQDVEFETPSDREPSDEEVVSFKTSVQEVQVHSTEIVDDGFLGKIKLQEKDGEVSIVKTEGKALPPAPDDDEDSPILFKPKKPAKPKEEKTETAFVPTSADETPDEDKDAFPEISKAQVNFNTRPKAAKNVTPVADFDDLDGII